MTTTTTEPFDGRVRMDWFQSYDALTFTFYVTKRHDTDVAVTATPHSVDVTIKLDDGGREYHYGVERLYAPLRSSSNNNTDTTDTTNNATDTTATVDARVVVKPMKVEVTVHKATPATWPALEGVEGGPTALLPASARELPKPSNRGKDWSHVQLDDAADEQSQDALDKLFKQIYGNGTDEQRRAMIKSFTESGGTVLSTNWDDVGKRRVVAEPPKGMEPKKLDE